MIGILVVVGIVEPYLILPTFLVMIIFLKIRKMYMITTRNIKRLEGVSKNNKLYSIELEINLFKFDFRIYYYNKSKLIFCHLK